MSPLFELQGHRGARGLKPENTLPSFEAALDAGVTSIETDLHLTQGDAVVLCHDPILSSRLCSVLPCAEGTPLRCLTLSQVRKCRADRNPDVVRFPEQNAQNTPVANLFAQERALEPFGIPMLSELFDFAAAYAGEHGQRTGKSDAQRERASQVRFDLELKRIPFHPEAIGDDYQGRGAGLLEHLVASAVVSAGVAARTRVRSFDHRCVLALRELEPSIAGAVLFAELAPIDAAELARRAVAQVSCPNYLFLDADQVKRTQAGGVRVIPWTANEPAVWKRLLEWGVDGITTDYPNRLADFLRGNGVDF